MLAVAALSGLLTACASRHDGYRQQPAAQIEPEQPAQDDRSMYLALIRQMQQQGAYYASLAHVEAYLQRYGTTPELRLLQADALRETGQVETAEATYTALTSGAQAAPAWHGLGLIAARRSQEDRAEQALAKASQLDPLNATYLGDLGFALLRSGRLDQAQAPLAKAAELSPHSAKAVANLALWALLRQQPAQAEAMMRQAELPEATRNEVYRLAQTLRNASAARPAQTAATNRLAASTRPPPAAAVPRAPTVGSHLPRSMLERFQPSADSSPREAMP